MFTCFYKFDKLAISIYLVQFTSLILVFSTSASQAQLTRLASGTCIHTTHIFTDDTEEMTGKQNILPLLLSFSPSHDPTQKKHRVFCADNTLASRLTSCSLTWITLFPELYSRRLCVHMCICTVIFSD